MLELLMIWMLRLLFLDMCVPHTTSRLQVTVIDDGQSEFKSRYY